MDDPNARAGTLLGDYRLEEFLAENSNSATWLASQASIGRRVLLIELKPTALDRRDAFLADVRAQAAIDHPLIGSVYEAVSTPEHCFATLERLPGSSLADRLQAREALKPLQLDQVLRQVADTSLTLEASGIATAPLGPSDIFLDAQGVVRLVNLARAGQRDPARSAGDIDRLGQSLPPLVADGHPGASRLLTLLAWMRGEGIEQPLGWDEIKSYTEQIERQLTEAPVVPVLESMRTEDGGRTRLFILLGIAALVVAAGVGVLLIALKNRGGSDLPLPGPVTIPAGEYRTPTGGKAALTAFTLAAHEVTIGEYGEFLDALASLPAGQRRTYDHSNQPADKEGHEPEGWAEILAALESGGQWQGRVVSRGCPVTNIDWWDAVAYCEWKGCRLPTHEEWFAALTRDVAEPASVHPAGWGPVQEMTPSDRTPSGLLGMAGSVAEWTNSQSINPANPLGGANWVLVGGSYLQGKSNATSVEWTTERRLRRPDLGFRVVLR